MRNTKRKTFLTIDNAEELTGVHYTLKYSGKMSGMQSLSTSCLCNKNCLSRVENSNLVCSHCYAQRQMKMYKNLEKCLKKNTEILTTKLLTDEEIPLINAAFFRFESFGDLNNEVQIVNYFRICKRNKHVKFALWTKNPWIIAEAINNGESKPRNLQIVYSSPYLNKCDNKLNKYPFIDKIFTVYTKEYIEANNIEINCGAKSCLSCHKCYIKSKVVYINERCK